MSCPFSPSRWHRRTKGGDIEFEIVDDSDSESSDYEVLDPSITADEFPVAEGDELQQSTVVEDGPVSDGNDGNCSGAAASVKICF